MASGPWTDEENDLIVADYFAMLADDMAGRPYNKAQHRRSLMPLSCIAAQYPAGQRIRAANLHRPSSSKCWRHVK